MFKAARLTIARGGSKYQVDLNRHLGLWGQRSGSWLLTLDLWTIFFQLQGLGK